MQPPRFWRKSKWHPLALALAPLGWIYGAATARRLRRGAWERLSVPVICVGNINAGGTGKTPTVIALASLLAARGVAAHVVSRGYGGTEEGPLKVNEMVHVASEVGDEPLLMAAFAPTWVAKDRALGAKAAIAAGAEVILLDDGFQNPALHKDLSIIVVDAAVGFGNGRVLPAGPLREPVAAGLKRGDVILSIGNEKAQAALGAEIATLPRLQAALKPLPMGMDWQGARVLAFAGIGRPEKFFRSLTQEGAEIVARHSFADHAPYSSAILQRLLKEAAQKGAQLVTTEKDAARLPASFRPQVLAFPVRLVFEDEAKLEAMLREAGVQL
jgi:tetraacyldisaccharide 4'-kinase